MLMRKFLQVNMFSQNAFRDEIIDPVARFKADYDRWFLLSLLVVADGKRRNIDYIPLYSLPRLFFFAHLSTHGQLHSYGIKLVAHLHRFLAASNPD